MLGNAQVAGCCNAEDRLIESATENIPPQRRFLRCGKGEMVRQERTARLGDQRGTVNLIRSKIKQ